LWTGSSRLSLRGAGSGLRLDPRCLDCEHSGEQKKGRVRPERMNFRHELRQGMNVFPQLAQLTSSVEG
jgi:hypothetical protein